MIKADQILIYNYVASKMMRSASSNMLLVIAGLPVVLTYLGTQSTSQKD